jgi:hypothetical protein
MFNFADSAPTSLAKEIFTAWKALQAYLIISAVRRETSRASTPSPSYRAAVARTAGALEPPTTTSEGSRKSRTADPSRRNSGLDTTETCASFAKAGMMTSSQVPGNTVLRMATIKGLVLPATLAATSSTARFI